MLNAKYANKHTHLMNLNNKLFHCMDMEMLCEHIEGPPFSIPFFIRPSSIYVERIPLQTTQALWFDQDLYLGFGFFRLKARPRSSVTVLGKNEIISHHRV